MEHLSASKRAECAICGGTKEPGEVWFLLTENCWEDKLRIWKWNREMSCDASARSVCSQGHARELVIHWMITGCLHYPFASVPLHPLGRQPQTASLDPRPSQGDAAPSQIGELSVDREGIARAMINEPWSLNAVLDELMFALDSEVTDGADAECEEPSYPAPRMV